jgi:hypothetical protein
MLSAVVACAVNAAETPGIERQPEKFRMACDVGIAAQN